MNEQVSYPSIDKPWLKYYSREAIEAPLPECTVWENVWAHNEAYPDDVALLYFGRGITYHELFVQVDATACALIAQGVGESDDVAICMPAMPEAIYAILALNRIGANAILLNPMFTADQLSERVSETRARLLLVANELWESVEAAIPQTGINVVVSCPASNSLGLAARVMNRHKKVPRSIPWRDFIKRGSGVECRNASDLPDRPALMVFSSGTTGASKGIQLTNAGINASILDGGLIDFDWKRQDRYFAQVPIWFSTGIVATILVPLRHGITVMLEPVYDFDLFYDHINKYHPNFMITAIGLLEHLMSKREISPAYKEFKYLVAGGEYVSPQMERKLNAWLEKNGNKHRLHKGYGMCECGGTVTATFRGCNEVGSAGVPLAHVTVSAFDLKSGTELPCGERGEIRVLTPSRMLGYHERPDATRDYFWLDGQGRFWACTGDMGYVSETGSVFVSGRLSDSYTNDNGVTVYLFDVERALLSQPLIRQCKAVAARVDNHMVHICHVVLDEGSDVDTALAQAVHVCAEDLPAGYAPRQFKLWEDALPVSPSGKLDVALMSKTREGLIAFTRDGRDRGA